MKRVEIINGVGKRYLSELPEFSDGIPFGVVNKKMTDVGGTFCAINCKSNYIVVVPFRDLATSIESDVNNKYPVFKLFGGVTKYSLTEYLKNNDTKKIAVTYDSFDKLTSWLVLSGENLEDYKVLVDEYHLILEDLDFRDEAINSLVEVITRYKHYSYLSATPITFNFEFDFLKELPHYELDFGTLTKIKPFKIKTPNVYKAAVALINEFKNGLVLDDINGNSSKVEELHIFLNSVTGIGQICTSARLDKEEVKIVCADRIRNSLVLKDYDISSISEPNAPINFYTKKGFQGCNIFSNNALVVVISDARVVHSLVDIETSLVQIVGRIRLNDFSKNIFRHKLYHIYSTNKNIQTEEEFNEFIRVKKDESQLIYSDLMAKDIETRNLYISRMNFESDFISVVKDKISLNLRKEQLFRYKFELKKSYRDGISIRDKYDTSNRFLQGEQLYSRFDDVILSKIVKIKLEDLYALFLEDESLEVFGLEYPEFYEYKKYLKPTEMSSLRWNKDKIDNLLIDKKAMSLVHRDVALLLEEPFISSADLKALYKSVMNKYGIKLAAKATLVESNKYLESSVITKKVNGITTKGFNINKRMYVL